MDPPPLSNGARPPAKSYKRPTAAKRRQEAAAAKLVGAEAEEEAEEGEGRNKVAIKLGHIPPIRLLVCGQSNAGKAWLYVNIYRPHFMPFSTFLQMGRLGSSEGRIWEPGCRPVPTYQATDWGESWHVRQANQIVQYRVVKFAARQSSLKPTDLFSPLTKRCYVDAGKIAQFKNIVSAAQT